MTPTTQPRRRRGGRSRAPLTRERILEAALELLADDPDGEISMRALADALGTAPMSLYRHVRNKDDLLDGITDLTLGRLELDVPDSGPWRTRALAWMTTLRTQLHDHPAVVPLLRTHTRYSPALLRATNTLLRILRRAGFADPAAARACQEIMWFTFGFVVMEIRSAEAFPDTEVGAIGVAAFPRPGSSEEAELSDLVECMPHLLQGDSEETFGSGARHLLAGLDAELGGGKPS